MPFALVAALASNVPVVASKLPAVMELSQFVEVHGFPTPLTLLQSEASTDLSKTVVRRLGNRLREYKGLALSATLQLATLFFQGTLYSERKSRCLRYARWSEGVCT